ncbi:MAG: hypothetical protein IKU55_01950 [Clostridia bacterium]|nr:hypothetical protein [Clostridia bacterium]
MCVVKCIYERERTATVDPIALTVYTTVDSIQEADLSATVLLDLSMCRQLFGGSLLNIQLRFESLPPLPDSLAEYTDDFKNLLLTNGLQRELFSGNNNSPNMETIYFGPYWVKTKDNANLTVRLFLYIDGRASLQISYRDELVYTINFTGNFSPFGQALTALYR